MKRDTTPIGPPTQRPDATTELWRLCHRFTGPCIDEHNHADYADEDGYKLSSPFSHGEKVYFTDRRAAVRVPEAAIGKPHPRHDWPGHDEDRFPPVWQLRAWDIGPSCDLAPWPAADYVFDETRLTKYDPYVWAPFPATQRVGPVAIASKYHARIARLPNVRFAVVPTPNGKDETCAAVYFTFGGVGEGLVMPCDPNAGGTR